MTPNSYPDEGPRHDVMLRGGWQRAIFFGGLVVSLLVVLVGQYLWT
jgi:hypothetical protein